MIRFHSFMFTSKLSFLSWVGEILILLDAGMAVVTLGVVEINLSVLWFQLLEQLYPDSFNNDNRDNF